MSGERSQDKEVMQGDHKLPAERLMCCQCFCVGITCIPPRTPAAFGWPEEDAECETCVLPAVPKHSETQLAILVVVSILLAVIEREFVSIGLDSSKDR